MYSMCLVSEERKGNARERDVEGPTQLASQYNARLVYDFF